MAGRPGHHLWRELTGRSHGRRVHELCSSRRNVRAYPYPKTVFINDVGVFSGMGSLRSTECLGFHLGDPQSANLGDGNGAVNQTVELREVIIKHQAKDSVRKKALLY